MRICRSAGAPRPLPSSLDSLERFKPVTSHIILLLPIVISFQFFTEEMTSSLLSPEGTRLLGDAQDLDPEANAALQALLLASAK